MANAPEKRNKPSIILIFIEENFSSPLKFFQLGKMKKAEGKQGRERKEDGTSPNYCCPSSSSSSFTNYLEHATSLQVTKICLLVFKQAIVKIEPNRRQVVK